MGMLHPGWAGGRVVAGRLGIFVAAAAVGLLTFTGCSVREMAVNQLGSALAGGGGAFAAEDDIELAAQAIPFSLKLIESLLMESPRNGDLLLAAARGYTQYTYGFVQQPAEFVEETDFRTALAEFDRARRLYLRAHDYALRGLELRYPGISTGLAADPNEAVRRAGARDVELLYWAAASLGSAISLSKTDPEMIARQPVVEALIDRAHQLNPAWGGGAIHEFLITYEMARQGASGDPADRARRHFDRAVDLSGGVRAGPYVTFAETVAVARQDRAAFEAHLEQALEVEIDASAEHRLANRIAQERAKWLLTRKEELFLE